MAHCNNQNVTYLISVVSVTLWAPIIIVFLQMLSRLLGILALCSLCSAMLNNTAPGTGFGVDNTIDWRGSGSNSGSDSGSDSDSDSDESGGHFPFNARARHHHMPGPPSNMTRMMMREDDMPILPDLSICDMLLSSPNPPPINEIPFFCLCSHCKGTVGPKGDRGDRGLPGTWITLNDLFEFCI